jgi:hypothetical protein
LGKRGLRTTTLKFLEQNHAKRVPEGRLGFQIPKSYSAADTEIPVSTATQALAVATVM